MQVGKVDVSRDARLKLFVRNENLLCMIYCWDVDREAKCK